MPDTTTDDLARTEASARRRQLPPTPERPVHLFTIDGIRYEAVRELVLMETGEVLMLAQRFTERGNKLPGYCFVRRLANPS
ncbi:serine/threonine protein kinase, partial [Corallococcus exiguus]|nr:serine/threonine protein kinase [Corallococcus exiguus]